MTQNSPAPEVERGRLMCRFGAEAGETFPKTFPRVCGKPPETQEAPPGFEPGMEDLQSSALPLGHGAGTCRRNRAGNRIRTGDLNLGKVALYQLSYARRCPPTTSGGPDRKRKPPCAPESTPTPILG